MLEHRRIISLVMNQLDMMGFMWIGMRNNMQSAAWATEQGQERKLDVQADRSHADKY
jgi:hypothetical protein